MNRDERLLILMHGGATGWERVAAWCDLACSQDARKSYRRYASVSRALRATLADPEDLVTINLPRRRAPEKTGALLLLGALSLIVFFEWRNYTIPALTEVIRTIAHRCGL